MKARKDEVLTVILFCGFLAVMMVCFLVLPKQDFSELEKRYLETAPEMSWENLASGQLGEDIEAYLADHIPGRDFFVGLNAYHDLTFGRQVTKDVRLLPGNRLVEAPVVWDEAAVQKNMLAINAFAETVGQQVDLMIIPSAGWAADSAQVSMLDFFSEEEYRDSKLISDICALGQGYVNPVDMTFVLEGREDLYYKTDHHWTTEGAYMVYAAYMQTLGRAYPAREAFAVETVKDFRGSTYSRSALWLIPGDTMELWHSAAELLVTNGESDEIHKGVYYRERLEETDKYTVNLDGNHSIVRIENPQMKGKGKLLVIRDSYANSLGVFLAESYETVVLVDLRYYKKAISELCAQEKFDDILICYSIGNFMTDANIIWLR